MGYPSGCPGCSRDQDTNFSGFTPFNDAAHYHSYCQITDWGNQGQVIYIHILMYHWISWSLAIFRVCNKKVLLCLCGVGCLKLATRSLLMYKCSSALIHLAQNCGIAK